MKTRAKDFIKVNMKGTMLFEIILWERNGARSDIKLVIRNFCHLLLL